MISTCYYLKKHYSLFHYVCFSFVCSLFYSTSVYMYFRRVPSLPETVQVACGASHTVSLNGGKLRLKFQSG